MRRAAALLWVVVLVACHGSEAEKPRFPPGGALPHREAVQIEPRSHLLPAYPCSSCHAERTVRLERYELKEFHQVRNQEFSHGEDAFWCFQCHASKDLDQLVTSTGELVSFDDAWRLCTSCHGDKLNDWRRGVHGLLSGEWNGKKLKKSCPACHDPHDPRFPSITPEAPPQPPRGLKAL